MIDQAVYDAVVDSMKVLILFALDEPKIDVEKEQAVLFLEHIAEFDRNPSSELFSKLHNWFCDLTETARAGLC